MKISHLPITLMLMSSLTYACGLHQDTGFSFVTEPGSLDVFEQVISVRQSNALGNVKKPDHFRLFTFKGAINEPYEHKLNFTIFEAVKGHYSEATVAGSVVIAGRETQPTENDVLIITELDVLDALATKVLTWSEAKKNGLVKLNGNVAGVKALDSWFSVLFSHSI